MEVETVHVRLWYSSWKPYIYCRMRAEVFLVYTTRLSAPFHNHTPKHTVHPQQTTISVVWLCFCWVTKFPLLFLFLLTVFVLYHPFVSICVLVKNFQNTLFNWGKQNACTPPEAQKPSFLKIIFLFKKSVYEPAAKTYVLLNSPTQ